METESDEGDQGSGRAMASVVLPTYNERKNLGDVVGGLLTVDRIGEVIVVDDDSPDGTADHARSLANTDARIKVIQRREESGLPSAIRTGIDAATGAYIGWMDCDGSHPPSKVPELIEALDSGAGVALGSRFVEGGAMEHGWTRTMMSREVCTVASLVLGHRVHDYTSGFIMARAGVLEDVGWSQDHTYGEYCIEFLYRVLQSYLIREVPYVSEEREAGSSKTTASVPRLCWLGIRYHAVIAGLAVDRFTRWLRS